jgi:hypothetical protein
VSDAIARRRLATLPEDKREDLLKGLDELKSRDE